MLDASSSETPKAKKKTPQNRPLQRFWPDSIATGGGNQQQVTMPDGTQRRLGCSQVEEKLNVCVCVEGGGGGWVIDHGQNEGIDPPPIVIGQHSF